MFIAEERINNTLKSFLLNLKKLDQAAQRLNSKYICRRIYCDVIDIFYDDEQKIGYYCDFILDNVLLRNKENGIGKEDIEEIPVYYFRNNNY